MTKSRKVPLPKPDIYIATALIWKTDTECIPVPVLGLFGSPDDATKNAVAVIAQLARAMENPELMTYPLTVTPTKLDEAGVRAFLARVKQERPELLR